MERRYASGDGKGFDISALESFAGRTGLGLIRLRERASYIDGSLTIESTPGKGSRFILASLSKTTSSSKLLKAIYGNAGDAQETMSALGNAKGRKPNQLKLPSD